MQLKKKILTAMDAIRSKKQPTAPVRTSKSKQTNGMHKLYSKLIHKIEKIDDQSQSFDKFENFKDLVPKQKFDKHLAPKFNSKVRNEALVLSDDEEYYSKMNFNSAELSLEDEIFEELEKVAHDETKLNAALQSFDKILFEYNDRSLVELPVKVDTKVLKVEKEVFVHKPLQKSKTCSIIESKCILKKGGKDLNEKIGGSLKDSKNVSVEGLSSSANYYQITKSLWNLQDLEDFSKSAQEKIKDLKNPDKNFLTYTKKKNSPPLTLPPEKKKSQLPKAKSVWDVSSPQTPLSKPPLARQLSTSKIPIKSSKLSTSMLQLNSPMSTSANYGSTVKLNKCSVFASTSTLSTPPIKGAVRRSSLASLVGSAKKTEPPKVRRSLLISQSTNNLTNISRLSPAMPLKPRDPIKLTRSEPRKLIQAPLTPKITARPDDFIRTGNQNNKSVPKLEKLVSTDKIEIRNFPAKKPMERDLPILNSRKIVPRKLSVPALSTTNVKPVSNTTNSKISSNNLKTLKSLNLSVSQPDNNVANHHNQAILGDDKQPFAVGNGLVLKQNEETMQKMKTCNKVENVESADKLAKSVKLEISEKKAPQPKLRAVVPVLFASEDVVDAVKTPPQLEKVQTGKSPERELFKKETKDYMSDCSDDSGHISNEAEDLAVVNQQEAIAKVKSSGKISEDLLMKFESKSPTKSARKLDLIEKFEKFEKLNDGGDKMVMEMNQVNLIKSSVEIFPGGGGCKSEVTFWIQEQ